MADATKRKWRGADLILAAHSGSGSPLYGEIDATTMLAATAVGS